MLGGVLATYRRHRYFALFLALLITIAGHGALGALGPGVTVLEILLAITLVTAIAAAFQDRAIRILLALACAFVVTRVVGGLLGVHFLMPISQALWVLASLTAIVATFRHALHARVVNTERIFAALDAYLLTGLMFGVSYWVLDQVSPAAFGAPSASDLTLDQAVYFSFVTIATVGYGDIVPVGAGARGLTILEGVTGQMYLAVLVAWLVSLFARGRES
jgi:hypothetical protein